MVISLDLGEEMFVHAIVLALDLYTQTQLQRVDFYIGSASVYTSNPVCPGGPHTVGGNYGAEVWCNQPGRYVTVHADLSPLNGSTFEVSICNLGVFGTKYKRDVALPSQIYLKPYQKQYTLKVAHIASTLTIGNTLNIKVKVKDIKSRSR